MLTTTLRYSLAEIAEIAECGVFKQCFILAVFARCALKKCLARRVSGNNINVFMGLADFVWASPRYYAGRPLGILIKPQPY